MKENISELEFQVALMSGYYTLFKTQDNFNLYLPTAKEEKDYYASDWFYENVSGIPFYLQFKGARIAAKTRINQRSRIDSLNKHDTKGVFEFSLHKGNQQHNLLYDNSIKKGHSFYVAPMFTSRRDLYKFMKQWLSGDQYSSPYIYKLFINMKKPLLIEVSNDHFSFFKKVIYIKPHKEISDKNKHCYCYNDNYMVSFHSEMEVVSENAKDGLSFISSILSDLEKDQKKLIDITREHHKEIKDFVTSIDLSELRALKLFQLLGIEDEVEKDDPLIHLEILKESQTGMYIDAVNLFYEKIFGVKLGFVYKTF